MERDPCRVARGVAACTAHGLVSYPFYMIHIPAQSMVTGVIRKLMGGGAERLAPWLGFVMIGGLLTASWLARYVDLYLRRVIERVVLRRRSGPPG